MADPSAALLLGALRDPVSLQYLDESEWDLLLRVARRALLLGRLAIQILDEAGLGADIPPRAATLLAAARVVPKDQARMLRWEVDRVQRALRGQDVSLVLLKGAAYELAGLPPRRGRLVSDLDLLVTDDRLPGVEVALLQAGWEAVKLDAYDQRYYRTWMHELPPLRHPQRNTELDVHHTILPPTSRLAVAGGRLMERAIPLSEPGLRVLCPEDMVLHTAVHLFHDGDLAHGLRDLVDQHDLLTHFGANAPDFWERLVERTRELGLQRPCFYVLRYTRAHLGTAVPDDALLAVGREGRPVAPVRVVMDQLIGDALRPSHPEHPRALSGFYRWLLYVRSHYLRMPLRLLIPHLFRKATRRESG